MAKFSLPMKDGVAVRKMSELREHFDLKEAIKYLGNGRLMTWLRDRGYDEEADKLDALAEECKGNHTELAKGLCAALGMEFDATKIGAKEFEGLNELSRRADRLGQFTDNKALLATADRAAFDQADLDRLAKDGNPDIYLCNGQFIIPLEAKGKHYHGVGNAIAVIRSSVYVDFDKIDIHFDNLKFDDAYATIQQEITTIRQQKDFFQKAEVATDEKDYAKAMEYYQKSADMGNTKAWIDLGGIYYNGDGVSQDYNKAMEYFRRAADENEPGALFMLGQMFRFGEGIEKDDNKAFRYMQDAISACQDNAEDDLWRRAALYAVGQMYREGHGTEKDASKGFKYLLQSAELGDTDAMNAVGFMYEDGEGVANDIFKAKDWYTKAAELEHITAMTNLGHWYETYENEYAYYDFEKAVKWYRKAMEAGDTDAKYRLGELYLEGHGVPKEEKTAFTLFEEAAKDGHIEAMNYIGVMYDRGDGTTQDKKKAIDWYRKAADAGNAIAMNNLGYSYEIGDGVPKDYKQAANWYKKAADEGYPSAMTCLGRWFAEGIGGQKKDLRQARIWFKKAADAGDSDAMCWLGNMYYQGEGVTSDKKTAREWYRKSADQGNSIGMTLLGDWYSEERNFGSAREWYKKAMDMGNGRAAYELAKLFEEGKGSNKNAEQAKQLREKAKQLGYDGSDGGGLLGTVASYAVGGALGLGVAALSPWAGAAAGAVGLASWLFGSKKK